MSHEYKDLRLEKYERLLELAVGRAVPLALFDASGSPHWTGKSAGEMQLEGILADLCASGFAWETGSHGRRQRNVGAQDALFYEPVRHGADDTSWLVALLPQTVAEAPNKVRALLDALGAVATCCEDECRAQVEASGLAGELSRRYEELNLVYLLDGLSRPTEGFDRNLRPLLQRIGEHMGVDIVAFVSQGDDAPADASAAGHTIPNLDLVLVEVRGDLFRFVTAGRDIVVLNHPGDPRREFLFPHLPYKFLACPVTRCDFQGMLALVRHQQGPDFENSDRSLAQVIGEQIGTLLRSQRLIHEMKEFGEQLAGALIEAVEAKDPYTRGHSERVQAISVYLGRKLGLEERELQDLYWGAIMHDIGKMGVPDLILSKPGSLTTAEFTFVRTHPERSYEILRHIKSLSPEALAGARYHHERYDGTGYPRGLRGRDIPHHARIIAVADAYDAMTSSRSYRSARSHDDALAEIARASGTQLDPEIASAFQKACRDDMRWLERIVFRDDDVGE